MRHDLILNEPLANGLDLIGDRWTLLILREAFYGFTRFEDFRKNLNISRATLTRRLKSLTDIGIFRKTNIDGRGRKEYQLSKKGAGLLDSSLLALQWESEWGVPDSKIQSVKSNLRHTKCGQPLEPVTVCAHCNEVIHYSDIQWLDQAQYLDKQAESIRASNNKHRRQKSTLSKEQNGLVDIIADRWSMLILIACFMNIAMFDSFVKNLNIPSSILANRLQLLQSLDVLGREQYQTNRVDINTA